MDKDTLSSLRHYHYEKSKEYLLGNPSPYNASWYVAYLKKDNDQVVVTKDRGALCHAPIPHFGPVKSWDPNRSCTLLAFGSGFYTKVNNPDRQHKLIAYWEYLTSHRPWADLLGGAKLHINSVGRIVGWTAKPAVFYSYDFDPFSNPFNRFKHLAILTRFPAEKPYILDMWYDLVSRGYSPHDALLLAHIFIPVAGDTDKYQISGSNHKGGHSGITLSEIDYRAYAQGMTDTKYTKTLNGFFRFDEKIIKFRPMISTNDIITPEDMKSDLLARFYDGFNVDKNNKIVVYGGMNRYKTGLSKKHTLDELVETFESWKKDNMH